MWLLGLRYKKPELVLAMCDALRHNAPSLERSGEQSMDRHQADIEVRGFLYRDVEWTVYNGDIEDIDWDDSDVDPKDRGTEEQFRAAIIAHIEKEAEDGPAVDCYPSPEWQPNFASNH